MKCDGKMPLIAHPICDTQKNPSEINSSEGFLMHICQMLF